MLKLQLIAIILILIYVLDKLYLLPLYVPLDTKPNSRRSATYLAKTIAKEAKCDDIWLLDINYNEGDTILNFDCNFGDVLKGNYVPFYIHVFLNDKIRDKWINKRNTDTPHSYHNQCFKKGSAYMICERSFSLTLFPFKKDQHIKHKVDSKFPSKTGETGDRPIFHGQRYYSQFPGEDINHTNKQHILPS